MSKIPVINQTEQPLGNDDLVYTVTEINYDQKFSVGDIVKIKITNITEDNKVIEGNYYLSSNSIYCELPYLLVLGGHFRFVADPFPVHVRI